MESSKFCDRSCTFFERENDEFLKAQDEWNNITAFPLIDLSSSGINLLESISIEKIIPLTSYSEVENHFFNLDISNEISKIKPIKERCRFVSFLRTFLFLDSPKLKSHLQKSRDRIFAVALLSFDNQNYWNHRALITIYHKLTNRSNCPRFGSHWQQIGFQGNDPATDFRGVGQLGIFQLLYFVMSPTRRLLAHDIYILSQDPIQNFPFAAMSTNITQITLHTLRSGKLNRRINEKNDPIEPFNDFYCDLFFIFFQDWKNGRKTIEDAGFVLKDIREKVNKNFTQILDCSLNYDHLNNQISHEDINFSNIGQVFGTNGE